jgi:hypothetical protein
MGDRGKPINFGDPMYGATWAGKVLAHVRSREVSRSLVAFEEDLRDAVSTGTVKTSRRCTGYK